MTSSSRLPARFSSVFLFGILLLLVIGVENFITHHASFSQHPALPIGVTVDMLVFVPTLFYFFVVRPYRLPLTSLLGVLGACLALASWLLPADQQAPLRALRLLPALLEAGALGLMAVRARRLVRAYQAAYAQEPRVWPSMQAAVRSLGAVGELLLAELNLLRYASLGWWATIQAEVGATPFSSHRESGFLALVSTAIGVMLVEMTCVHLLALHWFPRLAPWLLGLEAYSVVLLVAHAHAVRLQPVLLTASELRIRVGVVWEVVVPRTSLVAVELLPAAPAANAGVLNLAKLLFASPNLLLTFAEPVVAMGPYGIRRPARRVAVYLDQPRQFMAALGQPA